MKNCVVFGVIFLELAMSIMPIIQVSATIYTLGVKVGDWAKYTIIGGWDAYNVTMDMPQFVKDAKNTDWIQINVTKVSYTIVTVLVTTQFKNNTKKTDQNIGDIRTGSGNLSLQVTAANLDEGEKTSEDEKALTINRTTIKTYAKAPRKVNYAYEKEYAPQGEIGEESAVYEFYWDKASGIITGISYVTTFESQNFRTIASIIMQITETNIWQPENSVGLSPEWIAVAGIFVIAIVLAVFMAIRKLKKRPRGRRPRMPKARSLLICFSFENQNIFN